MKILPILSDIGTDVLSDYYKFIINQRPDLKNTRTHIKFGRFDSSSNFNNFVRFSESITNWREIVRKKSSRCEFCRTDKSLTVHHKIEINQITKLGLDLIGKESVTGLTEQEFINLYDFHVWFHASDKEGFNGLVVCGNCHAKIHEDYYKPKRWKIQTKQLKGTSLSVATSSNFNFKNWCKISTITANSKLEELVHA